METESANTTMSAYDLVVERARLQLEERVARLPDDDEAWFNLGVLARDCAEYERAEQCFQRVLATNPGRSAACVELGLLCRWRGDLDGAALWYRKAIASDPLSLNGHFNLGNWARDRDRFAEAEAEYDLILRLNPGHHGAWVNLGYVYEQQVRYAEALRCYRRALDLCPNNPGTFVNLGNLLKDQNELPGAIAAYRTALHLEPASPEAHHSLALALLATGEFEQGWEEYEWRLRCHDTGGRIGAREFTQPVWDGGRLEGKTIYVYGEQGLGDNIQFIRFLPQLKNMGATVMFGCYPHLLRLFEGIPGVDLLLDVNTHELPPFDTYIALMSIPHVLGIRESDLPYSVEYLHADPGRAARWSWIRNQRNLSVGLVWASNTKNRHAVLKSLAFSDLMPIVSLDNIDFYSLQIGKSGSGIISLEPDIETLEETAAIVENLNLVISIDTSIAHLAGALGKEVWLLLPFVADWRWPREGDATEWYPSMRLFRQTQPSRWVDPIHKIAELLRVMRTQRIHA